MCLWQALVKRGHTVVHSVWQLQVSTAQWILKSHGYFMRLIHSDLTKYNKSLNMQPWFVQSDSQWVGVHRVCDPIHYIHGAGLRCMRSVYITITGSTAFVGSTRTLAHRGRPRHCCCLSHPNNEAGGLKISSATQFHHVGWHHHSRD